jgi:hypothetical protein
VSPSDFPLTVRHFRCPNLLPGTALVFRVYACNKGGWSTASQQSAILYTPDSISVVKGGVPRGIRAVMQGTGVQGVCARMVRHSTILDVQLCGLKQIHAAAANTGDTCVTH